MSNTYYTSIPIILSKKEVEDLIELDTDHITKANPASLQTLANLNTQIITQLADFCVHHKTDEPLPLSIIITPMLPLMRGIHNG